MASWATRINNADKYYQDWERRFQCKKLEEYYEGKQWLLGASLGNYRPYVLNLVFSTIDTKLSSVIIKHPKYELDVAPGFADWDPDVAYQSATLKENVLNTVVNNKKNLFVKNIELAALDSFFRFAVIEVGYAADWMNPRKKQPLLSGHDSESQDVETAEVLNDDAVPVNERIYFKHIPAARFRVSVNDDPQLENCGWCGYYTFISRSVLIHTPGFKLPAGFSSTSTNHSAGEWTEVLGEKNRYYDDDLVKVWKIWDRADSTVKIFIDGAFEAPIWSQAFERLPFKTLRWNLRSPSLMCWYPIPPVSQWLAPQDAVNQNREQSRKYARRATRKYGYTGVIDEEELEKFTNEIDGEMIKFKKPDQIFPIDNPQLGTTATNDQIISSDDFNKVAGVSESRPSDRATATESRINAAKETIRESAEQIDFSEFLIDVGEEALTVIHERFTEDMWVRYTVDPSEGFLEEIQARGPAYKRVSAMDLDDGYDFTVKMGVINESPANMKEEFNKMVSFLSLITQFPFIAMDPVLLREAAYKSGYRNERVLQRMQQMALIAMMGQEGAQGAGGANNTAKATIDNNSNGAIGNMEAQLQGQLGV